MIQIILYFTPEPEEKCKFRPSFSDNENGDDLLGDNPVEKETENRPLSPQILPSIMVMISRLVSRMPSRPRRPTASTLASTPLTTMPSPA